MKTALEYGKSSYAKIKIALQAVEYFRALWRKDRQKVVDVMVEKKCQVVEVKQASQIALYHTEYLYRFVVRNC